MTTPTPTNNGLPEGLSNFMAFNLEGAGYHRGIHDITEDCDEECLTVELHAEGSRERLRELEAFVAQESALPCQKVALECFGCPSCRARALSKESQA